MKPRDVRALLQAPKAERLALVAQGLELLAEHVGALRDDLTHLQEAQRPRGAAVIDGLASEEAAKMLILLDVVRMGWSDEKAVSQQLQRFHNHLARGIYAEVTHGRPADFAEVRSYVDSLRRTHYLDGPNEVDWIFRNRVEAAREESLYVDYVTGEEGSFWITPATTSDASLSSWPTMVIDLVLALHRYGCTTEEGLRLIAKEWEDVTLADDTHWSVVEKINRKILGKLEDAHLRRADLTDRDVRLAVEHWTFPLGTLDFRRIEVTKAELAAERERWIARQWY
jgi:AbiV family abortive infection protein